MSANRQNRTFAGLNVVVFLDGTFIPYYRQDGESKTKTRQN